MRNLYISDLDGTLLNDSAELSTLTKANLKRIIECGIIFSVASARSIKSIQKMFEHVNISLPIIEFNGAFISDLSTGEHLVTNAIENEI